MRFDADVSGGHQFMNRAFIRNAMQFLSLGVRQYALECELDVQLVLALLLFLGIVFYLDGDAREGNVFLLAYIFRVRALQAASAASK